MATPEAGAIVGLDFFFVNGIRLNEIVSPAVEFCPVECDALLSDLHFADVGPDRVVELLPAHAKIGGGLTHPDEAGSDRAFHDLFPRSGSSFLA